MLASLLLTCVGGLIAITGSIVGQRMQARTERRSRAAQHDREDRFRLHKERTKLYSRFYLDMKTLRRAVMRQEEPSTRGTDEAINAAQDTAWWTFAKIRLMGSPDVVVAARSLMLYITAAISGEGEFELEHWSALVVAYRTAARGDLIGSDQVALPELNGEAEWSRAKDEGLI
jgi:hypothetical protein